MSQCFVFTILLLCFTACCSSASSVKFSSELEFLAHREFKSLVKAFVDGSVTQGSPRMLGSFSYKNCEDASKEVTVVSNLTVSPDPIKLPGNLTVSLNSTVKSKFGAPLKASLDVYKKILGLWIKIPCIDHVGSCDYSDICDLLAKNIKTCPPVLVKQGVTCRCPVSPAKISLKDYVIPLNIKVPSEVSGGVKVKVELKSGDTDITCIEVEVDIN